MVAVRAVVDVGSPIGGGNGISEARGAGGEGSAASGEKHLTWFLVGFRSPP
jgi:hypothetical protein